MIHCLVEDEATTSGRDGRMASMPTCPQEPVLQWWILGIDAQCSRVPSGALLVARGRDWLRQIASGLFGERRWLPAG